MSKIKVLIIEDSAVTRQVLTKIINNDPELEVVDCAMDPLIAVRKIEKYKPDVITLDLELPRMDGLTFLKKLMNQNPLPVVVISSLTEKGSKNAIKALEAGAIEVITKPEVSSPEKIINVSQNIQLAIKAAYQATIKRITPAAVGVPDIIEQSSVEKIFSRQNSHKLIAIGASTGGTEALKTILSEMDVNCPGILVVQHMPEMFTKSFADRLNSLCKIEVKEAEDNDEVINGRALIAPGNKHMLLVYREGRYVVRITETGKVNRHRPSVDVLFRTVALLGGPRATAVLLTGMGEDGAGGLLEIRRSGGFTIAQDKESSVVFGMPRRAIELGAAVEILPLNEIAGFLNNQITSTLKK